MGVECSLRGSFVREEFLAGLEIAVLNILYNDLHCLARSHNSLVLHCYKFTEHVGSNCEKFGARHLIGVDSNEITEIVVSNFVLGFCGYHLDLYSKIESRVVGREREAAK